MRSSAKSLTDPNIYIYEMSVCYIERFPPLHEFLIEDRHVGRSFTDFYYRRYRPLIPNLMGWKLYEEKKTYALTC